MVVLRVVTPIVIIVSSSLNLGDLRALCIFFFSSVLGVRDELIQLQLS